MEKKLFEKLLDSMGIAYIHTANRATQQLHQSRGRYSMTGDWIEEEFITNSEPDGIEIKSFANSPVICEYCDLLVEKHPLIHVQFRSTNNTWKVKCRDCKKDIENKDFNAGSKPDDK